MNTLDKIRNIHPDLINEFIRSGKSVTIPKDTQQVITQMSYAMEIYNKDRNISRVAKKLVERVFVSQGINISIPTAKSRMYSALSYFDVDQSVSRGVWLKDAANKFEDLAKIAVKKGDLSVAERCLTKSLNSRLESIDQEKNKSLGVVYLLSSEITAESLGNTSKNKKDIARKFSEGGYLNIINSLSVDDKQKKELIADCEIIEVVEIVEDE